MAEFLGVDIGGSGVKGAPVDLGVGDLAAERLRIDTPQPATPEAVAEVVAGIVDAFSWSGPIGCTFPGVVQHGVVHTAANVDDAWVGVDADALFSERCGCPVVLVNDADAAGVAEGAYGAAAGVRGLVVLVTLGTGIGTACLLDGQLVPNTELGHLIIDGRDAEELAASRVRKEQDLTFKQWARNVDRYLGELERLLWPELFVIGGGVSKRFDEWGPYLQRRTPVVPATLRNQAGIVGAALVASRAGLGDPS